MSSIIQIAGGYFDPEKHEYMDEGRVIIPSVTQILDSVGLVNYDNVPGDTLERKRAIGDAIHVATHFLDEGELDWDTVHEECVPYVIAWENFKKETGFIFDPETIEKGGIHQYHGMKYGYTRDRTGRFPGINYRFVIEIKGTYREEKSWKFQLASYAETVKKVNEKEYIGRVAVQLKKDSSYKCYIYEDMRDIDRFGWALGLTYTKISEGIPWLKVRT